MLRGSPPPGPDCGGRSGMSPRHSGNRCVSIGWLRQPRAGQLDRGDTARHIHRTGWITAGDQGLRRLDCAGDGLLSGAREGPYYRQVLVRVIPGREPIPYDQDERVPSRLTDGREGAVGGSATGEAYYNFGVFGPDRLRPRRRGVRIAFAIHWVSVRLRDARRHDSALVLQHPERLALSACADRRRHRGDRALLFSGPDRVHSRACALRLTIGVIESHPRRSIAADDAGVWLCAG